MTTLLQQIEAMRVHVNDLLSAERGLVKALGDDLQLADQELLKAIRHVAVEHEVRRGVILAELQSLAASVGLLSGPVAPLTHEISRRDSLGFAIQHEGRSTSRHEGALLPASFEEELRFHLNGRMN